MHLPFRRILVGTLLLAPVITLASPAPTQNLDSLSLAAKRWLEHALPPDSSSTRRITIQSPDPRLRLPRCTTALRFDRPVAQRDLGRIAIRARCPRPAWQLYLLAHVNVLTSVIVAQRPLAAGTRLRRADLLRTRRPLADLPAGAITRLSAAAGHILRHSLAAGTVLSDSSVAAAAIVRRGEQVSIIAAGEGLRLRAIGTAIQDGSAGQSILVRNAASDRVLRATVSGPHQVTVTF